MNKDYFSSLKADRHKKDYRQKLDLFGLKDYPYCLPADIWCNNPVLWPEMEHPDVYDYLTNTNTESERETQFLVQLFRAFVSKKGPRRAINNNHKETDSYVLSNPWFLIALKDGLLATVIVLLL